MKLLADQIATMQWADPVCRTAADVLRLPSFNHAVSPRMLPACERFVFDEENALAVMGDGSFPATVGEIINGCGVPRAPCLPAWIEIDDGTGWLLTQHADGEVWALAFADGRRAGNGWPNRIVALGELQLSSLASDAATWIPSPLSTYQMTLGVPEALLTRIVTRVVFLLYALAAARTVTTRRVNPSMGSSAAGRALMLRRAQRGAPVFSFNRVDLIRPQTALHNGVLRSVESFAGIRMHMAIGHWRLIDGVVEPYWVWVDGHHRGNRELGLIVKERHVYLGPGGSRRGFAIPAEIGRPGERRKAKAAS